MCVTHILIKQSILRLTFYLGANFCCLFFPTLSTIFNCSLEKHLHSNNSSTFTWFSGIREGEKEYLLARWLRHNSRNNINNSSNAKGTRKRVRMTTGAAEQQKNGRMASWFTSDVEHTFACHTNDFLFETPPK